MSVFVKATKAGQPKSNNIRPVSLLLVALLVLMIVGQLFTYEDFPGVIASYWLPGGLPTAYVVAALLVSLEVMALPFLLAMRLSPLMRIVSMICGWLVIIGWLFLSLWVELTVNAATNSGLLGATVPLPIGWWLTSFIVALGVLVIWTSWGLWPLGKKPRS